MTTDQVTPPVPPTETPAPASAPAAPPRPEPESQPLKQVSVIVPDNVPFAQVQVATELGLHVIGAIRSGLAFIAYPRVTERPDGTKVGGLGQHAVILMNDGDVGHLLKLADAINTANQQVIAARVSEGGVAGTGGIIVP